MMQSKSAAAFERGRRVIPDGVSSPMRSFSLVGGKPIAIASAKGSKICDLDGNVYTDFLNAFGALILGHAHEEVVTAIARQAAIGSVYGLCTELEYEVAEKIVQSTAAVEKVRFVCSGTEAVMTAVRIARAHTDRSLIVKFRGSYHGHSDALLASPTNLEHALVSKKGVTHGITSQLNRDVVLCEYNDVSELEQVFARHASDIAAVLVEPFATNMGFVKPRPGFLEAIRRACDTSGAVFIFDEVVTGFRFRFGGACSMLGIDPDLLTFGKIIGGGLPIGAFAGKDRFMRHVAKGGKVFQSGTFAANPLTMAAANAALDVLARPAFYSDLEARAAFLERALLEQFAARKVPYRVSRHGALAGIAYRDGQQPLSSYADVKTQRYDLYAAVHARMLARGFLLPPSLEEPIFISAAHSPDDLAAFAAELAETIQSVRTDQAARELVHIR